MTDIPKALWSGSFHVYGVEVKCHTLDNGRAIIEADSFHALLEAMTNPTIEAGDIENFERWKRGAQPKHE